MTFHIQPKHPDRAQTLSGNLIWTTTVSAVLLLPTAYPEWNTVGPVLLAWTTLPWQLLGTTCSVHPSLPTHAIPYKLTTVPWYSTQHPPPTPLDTWHTTYHWACPCSCPRARHRPTLGQTDAVPAACTSTNLPSCPPSPEHRDTWHQPIGCTVHVHLKHVYLLGTLEV